MTTGLLVIMCIRAGYIHVGVRVLKSLKKRTRYRNAFNGKYMEDLWAKDDD